MSQSVSRFPQFIRILAVLLLALGLMGGGVLYLCCVQWDWPFRIYGHYDEYAHGGAFKGSAFSLSSDGKTIVYASPHTGHGDLYLVNSDGAHNRRLTSDPACEGNPCFSPDGKQIAFDREDHKCGHIWIMNADGTAPHQLTNGTAYDENPCFTPDGTRIWFIRIPQGTLEQTEYEMDVRGNHPIPVRRDGKVLGCAPSFSKQSIIYYSYPNQSNMTWAIWSMKPDGTADHVIGKGESPAVSPDSKQVAFIDDPYGQRLCLMDADGSHRRQLYRTDGPLNCLVFSSDGQYIYFTYEKGTGPICRINRDGSHLKQIVPAL